MKCPSCNADNNDGAKFCKKCGEPLKKKVISHESMINSMNEEKSSNNTKIIIAVLIIIAVVLAGSLLYIYGFNNNASDSNVQQQADAQDDVNASTGNDEPVQATQKSTTQSTQPAKANTPLTILGGSFSTGSSLSDKTYAKIYVGSDHAGENVKVQIYYSRDGSYLNNGNIVPKTVTSDGYIEVASADSYKYYPDFAEISVYDNSGNLLDAMDVSLSPSSGSQSF